MNYCTNCGSKINKNNKFCSNCGVPIQKGAKIEKKDDVNAQKVILILGIFLVLFASFALGIISWKNLNEIFRIIFFAFECALFFVLSFVLKKVGSKLSRLFFTIGLILFPYTLSLIPYYGLISEYFKQGPGLYVFLAIIYLVTFILYITINIRFKSKFITYLSIFSLFISVISTGLIFSENIVLITLLIVIYMFILNIISRAKLFGSDTKKALSITAGILMILVVPFVIISMYNKTEMYNSILTAIIVLIYFISMYIRLYTNNNSIFRFFGPFILEIISVIYITQIINNSSLHLYVLTIATIILYFISTLFNNKLYKGTTLVVTYISLFCLIFDACIISNYQSLCIIGTIILIYNLINLLLFKYKFINYIIPINIFIIIYSLIKWFTTSELTYVLVAASLIFLIVYVILKLLKNKLSFTYLLTAFILLFISLLDLIGIFGVINVVTLALIFAIFILSVVFKESEGFTVLTFVTLNFAALFAFNSLEGCYYYGFLTVSGLTLLFSLFMNKITKVNLNGYILYSEILIFLLTLFNNMLYPWYALLINIFVFIISYISVIKKFNVKWYRILYMMLGLLTIIRVISTIIDPVVIASLISIFTLLVILVIIYLLEVEDNVPIIIMSLVILIPYYTLINKVLLNMDELYWLPLVVYDIALTEVIKFKSSETKKMLTIIPLSILSYFFIVMHSGVESILFDVIFSLILILLGLYRKYNYLIYFGIIFIIITIFISLFTVLNSIAVVIALIIIGFILIGVALFNELKKK